MSGKTNLDVLFFCLFFSQCVKAEMNMFDFHLLSFFPSLSDGQVIPLVELSAKQVAFHIPFEVVEKVYPPVPEQLQLRIAYWSFPENEEDIR